VEAALARLPNVREAVVVMHGETSEARRLTAYVVPAKDAQPLPADLWRDLRRSLPEYMIPAGIVMLAALPLTPNGKIDRRALPDPVDLVEQRKGFHVPPRDPLEFAIASIWRDLLGLANVGVRDNFFDLGGHSLLAVRMMALVEKACGSGVPLASLFSEPTIERLAEALRYRRAPIRLDGRAADPGWDATAALLSARRLQRWRLLQSRSGALARRRPAFLCGSSARARRLAGARLDRGNGARAPRRAARRATPRGRTFSRAIATARSSPSKWQGNCSPRTKRFRSSSSWTPRSRGGRSRWGSACRSAMRRLRARARRHHAACRSGAG
jgi:hypothetical protein